MSIRSEDRLSVRSGDRLWLVSASVAVLLSVLIASERLVTSLIATRAPWAWDYAEPIVYAQASRLLVGEPLYQPVGQAPLTVTAYTPGYYYAAAALQAVLGPGFWTGRALSYAAGLVCASCVAHLALGIAGSRWAALSAAALFLGLGFAGSVPWFALYRVDTLALALSLAAICSLTAAGNPRALVLAGVLAGLSLLTKQTFFAAPVAGTVWLARRSPRAAALYAGPAVVVAGVPCLLVQLSQPAFFDNTVAANLNPIAPLQIPFLWPVLETTLGPLTLLAALYVVRRRRPGAARPASTSLIALYWVCSAVSLLGLLKFGAFYNYWIEFAAATAVLAMLGTWEIGGMYGELGSRSMATVPVWLLIADLAFLGWGLVGSFPGSLQAAHDGARELEFAQLVQRVRDEPGPVLAEPMDVVALAGRQLMLEPVIFGIFQREGMWDPGPLVRSICAREVKLLILEMPLPNLAEYAPFGMPWWPEPVVRALQARMVATGQQAGRIIYTPAVQTSVVGTNVCS